MRRLEPADDNFKNYRANLDDIRKEETEKEKRTRKQEIKKEKKKKERSENTRRGSYPADSFKNYSQS